MPALPCSSAHRRIAASPRGRAGAQWLQDGAVIASGTVSIGPGATATVDLPWTWTFARRRIELVVDPGNTVVETEERNNRVGFDSDAISVGLYVERSVYNYFDAHQRELGVGSNSWEDWAKRQVAMWNDMFAASVYPEAPSGVLERIRLDQITVVNDGALPLAGGLATNDPNLNDRSVDLQWGFPASLLSTGFYNDTTSATTGNPFYYEASLLHELGHARYLVDVYGFNVHEDGSGGDRRLQPRVLARSHGARRARAPRDAALTRWRPRRSAAGRPALPPRIAAATGPIRWRACARHAAGCCRG